MRQGLVESAALPVGGGTATITGTVDVDQADQDLTYITGTVAVVGPTALVAAPGAGFRLVVSFFMIQNTTAVATTVTMQGAAVNVFTSLLQNQGDSFPGSFLVGREWKLAANVALNILLSGANAHYYNVGYYVEVA